MRPPNETSTGPAIPKLSPTPLLSPLVSCSQLRSGPLPHTWPHTCPTTFLTLTHPLMLRPLCCSSPAPAPAPPHLPLQEKARLQSAHDGLQHQVGELEAKLKQNAIDMTQMQNALSTKQQALDKMEVRGWGGQAVLGWAVFVFVCAGRGGMAVLGGQCLSLFAWAGEKRCLSVGLGDFRVGRKLIAVGQPQWDSGELNLSWEAHSMSVGRLHGKEDWVSRVAGRLGRKASIVGLRRACVKLAWLA